MILSALVTWPTFAYIDPNAGGYFFQLLAPLVAIAMAAWIFFSNQTKAIWHSIRRIFSRKCNKKN